MFSDTTIFNSHVTLYGYLFVMKLLYEDYKIITNLFAGVIVILMLNILLMILDL